MDANVVQTGSKVLQVGQLHLQHLLAFPFHVVEQLLQVTLVGIQRVGGVAALQFQVSLVGSNDICLAFLVRFHLISYLCGRKGNKFL